MSNQINASNYSEKRDSNEKIGNFTVRIPEKLLRLEHGESFSLNENGF
jgi:hypothetical protein